MHVENVQKLLLEEFKEKQVGGGVGLASAVDYCFATQHASIKLSELALGIGPFVVGPAVERKVGLSAMSALAINADKWFDANWGLQKGLYSEIFRTVNRWMKQLMD
jgi:methylglutaconyl-CoA hydratase